MDRVNRTLRAADMSRYASAFATRTAAKTRLPLDFSAVSLRIVDRVVDGLRRGAGDPGDVAPILQELGAYVGEVLVRQARARWVDFDDVTSELLGQPVGVRTYDGRAWNPLGKVVNRFELGPDESAYELFLLVPRRPKGLPLPRGTADGLRLPAA
ncbi:hypothetical protein [Streptomyces sp. NK15101]|uniref:hypothetical protein n=1 Tax=Streptomyces sp. NK15101 TaxID=2873261 RepID=UPI001CEC1E07|nr:hypothetical protein [Streptomyces sp. NK15101]